eukprot:TRINITY_DN4846_c0_g1_i1.p1 TRINITY_DN4846_c0_g1~~TRINITY_DN4846_c0_g1_i1.p1  ORF type:complete len:157 (+),score=48.63 TRINITY_DN4846_c0_g1_i1:34-504(+)
MSAKRFSYLDEKLKVLQSTFFECTSANAGLTEKNRFLTQYASSLEVENDQLLFTQKSTSNLALVDPQKIPSQKNVYETNRRPSSEQKLRNMLQQRQQQVICSPDKINTTVGKVQRSNLIAECQGNSTTRTTKKLDCLLYTSPSPRDLSTSRMPSSA